MYFCVKTQCGCFVFLWQHQQNQLQPSRSFDAIFFVVDGSERRTPTMRQRRGASPTVDDASFADDGSLQYDILKSRKRFQQKVALLQQSLSRRREERSASGASSVGVGGHGLSLSHDRPSRGAATGPSVSPDLAHIRPLQSLNSHRDPSAGQEPQYRLSPSPVPVRVSVRQHRVNAESTSLHTAITDRRHCNPQRCLRSIPHRPSLRSILVLLLMKTRLGSWSPTASLDLSSDRCKIVAP
jgi:hypothetical protein